MARTSEMPVRATRRAKVKAGRVAASRQFVVAMPPPAAVCVVYQYNVALCNVPPTTVRVLASCNASLYGFT